jgi:hypothetical protein
MDHLFGLPAHPLIVHIPVVLLPLAAVGVLVTLFRRSWYERYRWAVLAIGTVGTVGAYYSAASGEELEDMFRQREGAEAVREIHEHADAGEQARNMAILFLVVLTVYVVVPWLLDRRAAPPAASVDSVDAVDAVDAGNAVVARGPIRWLRPLLMVLVTIAAAASVYTVIDAGHTGASRAWDEYANTTDG